MDISIIKELVTLDKEKAELDSRLDEIKQRRADIATVVEDMMIDAGIDKITIDGRTVHIASQIWAKVESTKEQVINALKEAGLEEYITVGYNSQSLSAYVRNELEANQELPEALRGHLGHSTKTYVRSTKA